MAIYSGHNEDSSGNILLSIGNGMTATLESGTTASQAYTKGSYVFFDNKLCKVTQDITSGTTLEIGTNLAQTSIGTELTSHLRSNDGKEFYFDVKDGSYGFYPSASKVAEEFVPFGGTSALFRSNTSLGGNISQTVIVQQSNGSITVTGPDVGSAYTFPDGAMKYSALSGSPGSMYYKTLTFLKSGWFCVAGTWENITAGTSRTVQYNTSILYYDDLTNPFE